MLFYIFGLILLLFCSLSFWEGGGILPFGGFIFFEGGGAEGTTRKGRRLGEKIVF